MTRKNRSKLVLLLLIFLAISIGLAALFSVKTREYALREAEKQGKDILYSHRALQTYITNVQRSELYALQNNGQLNKEYFSPKIFSSTYIARNTISLLNEERRKNGLPEIYFKLASDNPRNPINKADPEELALLQQINNGKINDFSQRIYRPDGEWLYMAVPVQQTSSRCLKCHGDPKDAPQQLVQQYGDKAGFHEKEGRYRALISIRVPLNRVLRESNYLFAVLTAVTIATLSLIYLLVFLFIRHLDAKQESVNQAKAALERLNTELDQRVIERTEQLETANMQLAESNQELEAFCYSVSHDLRAPLRHIHSFSTILSEECMEQLDDTAQNYLRRISASSNHMGELIDDLLKLARVSRSELNYEQVDLSGIARDTLAMLHEVNPARSVEVVINEGLTAMGDETLLQMAMQNLLDNAWKYTSKQQCARIEFGKTTFNGNDVFFVSDNGVGFDMLYSDKLFSAFQRLHQIGDFEGTGVGLATVYRVMQRHGGAIWAEGKIGEGAIFYFTL